MVSGETFHVIARTFAVLALSSSIYGVFNCAVKLILQTKLEVDDEHDEQREFGALLKAAHRSTPVLAVLLVMNIISLGASVMLLVGIFKKKLLLVKIYKIYMIVSIVAVLVVCCIAYAILAEDKWWLAILILVVVWGVIVLPITSLIVWILNGEMRFIEQEQEREKSTFDRA